ncbi:hypothetical protein [Streptomyces sp. NPDC088350]|uniref:hypothetical protein n=1 Tax=Streptomyces sp. NPDC088350 TaxID=3365854 RepID=UPI00382D5D50
MRLGHRTRDHAHHREEIRRLKVAAFSHLDYPGARQAIQVVRWRRDLSTGKLTIERVYLITSLSVFDATCTELATWIRGHWGIENLLHHVRDGTFREDAKSAPAPCPAPWPPCATSPSASSVRTARPTSPPPSATPAATTTGPCEPSVSRDEPRQISIMQ